MNIAVIGHESYWTTCHGITITRNADSTGTDCSTEIVYVLIQSESHALHDPTQSMLHTVSSSVANSIVVFGIDHAGQSTHA